MSATQTINSSKFVRALAKQLHAISVNSKAARGAQEKSVLRLDATDVTKRELRQAIRKVCRDTGVRAARGFFGVRHPQTGELVYCVRAPGKDGWQATLTTKGTANNAKLDVFVSL